MLRAWDESKVTSKVEVKRKAKLEGKKVHFATLMDLCHLKNSELEKQFPTHHGGGVEGVIWCKTISQN